MYQRLQLLRNASSTEMDVDLETLEISEAYLAVINALSCVSEKNAWIFVWKLNDIESPAPKRVKREENSKTPFYIYKLIFRNSNQDGFVIGGGEEGVCS